jgi:outer membrane protein OmpA-like peptidoglycan-associated protein/tetratricopeptide (TPR) repeat protein
MKVLTLFLFLSLSSLLLFAQTDYSTTNKKAISYYERAGVYVDQRLYNSAIKELQNALVLDSNFLEAQHRIADIYRIQKEYLKAKEGYMKVLRIKENFSPQSSYYLAECYFKLSDYYNAKIWFEKFLLQEGISDKRKTAAQKYIIHCSFAAEAIKHPVPYDPKNLGPSINTRAEEYLPTITADDSTLIFTRKNVTEDFYISAKTTNGWELARPLSNKINTSGNEGAQCISPDGQYLFFAGCDRKDGLGKCDIYYSKLIGNEWSEPKNLGEPVNSPAWESQPTLSADGKTLYFVSDRRGGQGSYDIWQSRFLSEGKWSEPRNMGPNINTAEEEISPFIHPDNQTLYFGSQGWPGFGEYDIFFSKKKNDGTWDKPKNIGYPINTPEDENSLFISNDGKQAYFASSNLKGMGGVDLYSFDLYQEARPQPVTFVKGYVRDKNTGQKLRADFEIIDIASGDTLTQSNSNALSGQFLASLPVGKDYALNVNKENYLFYSDNFSLENKSYTDPFIIYVDLQKIEVGNKIALKNIFFETNSFKLKNQSKFELNKLVQFLKTNPKVILEIGGHTDNTGDDKSNLLLSNNRAKTVYDYLIKNGITAVRLKYKGYGETSPVDSNTTEKGKANNRRTEVKIIGN